MIDTKALEKLGLQEKDFKPKETAQEERIEELEKAMDVLLNGVTDDE